VANIDVQIQQKERGRSARKDMPSGAWNLSSNLDVL
jgi:hypothetical protein